MSYVAGYTEVDSKEFIAKQQSKKVLFLFLGYVATAAVGAAQIYFLMAAMYELDASYSLDRWQVVCFSFFFFFFSVLFLTRYVVLLLFAFLEASKQPNLKKIR